MELHYTNNGEGWQVQKHMPTVDDFERVMLEMPQADCPIEHKFFNGVYVRELRMAAGIIAVGHRQRFKHINNFIKGKVLMLNDDGSKTLLEAPMCFEGQPGRKVGYVIEDVVWQNIYATEETDIDKLEGYYLDKSAYSLDHAKHKLLPYDIEKADYKKLLDEIGITEAQVQVEVLNEDDQVAMPKGWDKTCVRDSDIAGKGFFATAPCKAGDTIAPARVGDFRTPAGRFTNHSPTPNAEMKVIGSDIFLVAVNDLAGAVGGGKGSEITVNYRDSMKFRGVKDLEVGICQG